MRVYQGKTLVDQNVNHSRVLRILAAAVASKSKEPLLLVREDGQRMLIVLGEGNLMLCLAHGPNDAYVSCEPAYSDKVRMFRGLGGVYQARENNFVDPVLAMRAIGAFFAKQGVAESIDLRRGMPDPEIITFPDSMSALPRVERGLTEQNVMIPIELRADMQEVCEYLDWAAGDPDENIDFDDAIQIGRLCGGRTDKEHDRYLFSYHLDCGDVWQFEVARTILDGIADGGIVRLKVTASVEC